MLAIFWLYHSNCNTDAKYKSSCPLAVSLRGVDINNSILKLLFTEVNIVDTINKVQHHSEKFPGWKYLQAKIFIFWWKACPDARQFHIFRLRSPFISQVSPVNVSPNSIFSLDFNIYATSLSFQSCPSLSEFLFSLFSRTKYI